MNESAGKRNGLNIAKRIYFWCFVGVAILYALSGLTIVGPSEVAIVQRLGRLRTDGDRPMVFQPGLLLAWPKPIDRVMRVRVKEERSIELTFTDATYEARLLQMGRLADLEEEAAETGDENVRRKIEAIHRIPAPTVSDWVLTGDRQLVALLLRAKYRIDDPVAFTLAAKDAQSLVSRTVCGAVTETLGHWSIDEAMRLQTQRLASRYEKNSADGNESTKNETLDATIDQAIRDARLPEDPTLPEVRRALRDQLSEAQLEIAVAALSKLAPAPQLLASAIRDRAQSRLAALDIGVTLSALEIQEIKPPTKSATQAFEAVQSARIAQETLTDSAAGEGQSEIINKQLLAGEYIADAEGKRATRLAEANEQANEFLAALSVLRNSNRSSEQDRLFYDAWQQIVEDAGKLYLVSPGGKQETRLRIPAAGE